ncbi:MAG: preprotein translocase subunit SecA, partial [Clostridia bacterium]|nr:preprotein translocase subunit SecA [Clostridia bacterium]
TNNEFGFDYLRDNMVVQKDRMVQRGHVFAIVDEVDSILIDEARTPLIISGEGDESTDMYDRADSCVRSLREHRIKEMDSKELSDDIDADYIVDEKARTAVLTASGIAKVERFFKIENLSAPENSELAHHVNQALKAHGIMQNDVDYLVKDDSVLIIDSFTGRIMHGRRFSDGLHQAIEAKEHVKIQKENKTLATITFQNYFRMYKKLSGMTGTALTEEVEFREIYGLDVVVIPTNKPMIRKDHSDVVYKNQKGKYDAIVEQIRKCHEKGQPVLVGTVSVEKSEFLSKRLKLEGIEHTVLNAKYHEKEAEIVAQAGRVGTVTIATNMAGRGTDILLGGNPEFLAKQEMRKQGYEEDIIGQAVGSSVSVPEEVLAAREVYKELYSKYKTEIEPLAKQVCESGGLFIVGTERHESRRIDNQLRGRSGRQGDPGESRFFLALDDDLMRLFGSDRVASVVDRLGLDDDTPIEAKILSNSIERAQKQIEENNFQRRKNVLTYDDVMNQQRTVIYKQRREVLDGIDLHEKIESMIRGFIESAVNSCTGSEDQAEWKFDDLRTMLFGFLCTADDFHYSEDELKSLTPEKLIEELTEKALKIYKSKDDIFGAEQMREIERIILLRNVDLKWMDHLENMDDLKESIGLQAYAQRDPINQYRIQGADMFDEMSEMIRADTVRGVLSVLPRPHVEIKREEVAHVTGEGFEGNTQRRPPQPRPAQVRKPAIGAKPSGPVIKPPSSQMTRAQMEAERAKKVGRNDPCPCGSGKKYKKCCGANQSENE